MAKLQDVIQRGTNAARPAATAVAVGVLYYDTTNSSLGRSNGTTWDSVEGAGGLADPMTTRGDIIVRNASNVTARLAVGTVGQVLTSDGTDTAWAAAAGGALTVKDEGSALATAATSLDFVGAGVVASGTGAAKTITIAGGGGGSAAAEAAGRINAYSTFR